MGLEAGFAGASGLGPGPNQSKEHSVTTHQKNSSKPIMAFGRKKKKTTEGNTAFKKNNSKSQ